MQIHYTLSNEVYSVNDRHFSDIFVLQMVEEKWHCLIKLHHGYSICVMAWILSMLIR